MAVYKRNLYLLVNTSSVTGVTDIKGLAAKSSLKINLGALDSDTYISAKTVTDAYAFTTPDFKTDDVAAGIEKVVSGEYNAAFIIDDSPSSLLAGIAPDAAVELIAVNMPEGKKYYSEDGTIFQGEYKFQGRYGFRKCYGKNGSCMFPFIRRETDRGFYRVCVIAH